MRLADRHQHTHHENPHHHHDEPIEADARLVSVGIDIGSATTQVVVSELLVGRPPDGVTRKPEVLSRRILHVSPVALTPYSDGSHIDSSAVARLVAADLSDAGLTIDEVDTGAVICTGTAAAKENAAAISRQISAASGRFICVVAGHELEAMLGAHGSGAVELSKTVDHDLILLDIGGGTTKRCVLRGGRVVATSALGVGARLVAFDGDGTVTRLEPQATVCARECGVELAIGARVGPPEQARIAGVMADQLVRFLGLAPQTPLGEELRLTHAGPPLPHRYHVAISGGVAEYFYGRTTTPTGDLGLPLAEALRARLDAAAILPTRRGIRATVVGTSQFTLRVSGSTLFLDGGLALPLRNVPARAVASGLWRRIATGGPVDDLLNDLLDGALADAEHPVALLVPPMPVRGYGAARALGARLVEYFAARPTRTAVVLVFADNIAHVVGTALAAGEANAAFVCLDELALAEFDFLDIGAPAGGGEFVPVIVKRLIISGESVHRPD